MKVRVRVRVSVRVRVRVRVRVSGTLNSGTPIINNIAETLHVDCVI